MYVHLTLAKYATQRIMDVNYDQLATVRYILDLANIGIHPEAQSKSCIFFPPRRVANPPANQ